MKRYLPFIILVVGLVAAGLYLEFSDNGSTSLFTDSEDSENLDLEPIRPAPEFAGISNWLNSEPLTIEELRGKVVLVDFWTYSCINCIRTLPYLTAWHENYADEGLVIVGVHTPEFAFEKDTRNVETAMRRHNIQYAVAQDNDFATWRAYQNRYWPAKYLVNQDGQIVYTHFGEGKYDETENAIRALLGVAGPDASESESLNNEARADVRTPEIYFGLSRLTAFSGSPTPSSKEQAYSPPEALAPNHFGLFGKWVFVDEFIEATQTPGSIRMNFYADKVFMVAESQDATIVEVWLDGEFVSTVEITESKLYDIVQNAGYGPHMLELRVLNPGLRAFTFTFG